ncbi:MAG: MBL fold metallo-hydrolase [Parcubacteria group bacterium]
MKSGLLIFLLVISNIFVFREAVKNQNEISVSFLDVGQGDSSLIRSEGIDLLIDTGPRKNVLYELTHVIPKTDRYIDLIVISHPHADHFGGLEYVLSDYDVGAIITSGSETEKEFNAVLNKARDKNIPVINFFAGSSVKTKLLELEIVYPPKGTPEEKLKDNDGSLVIFASIGELNGLFPGDITRKSEAVISAINFPETDFLKVPHHGSATSSSDGFLSAINPLVAVISVGQNSYGLPKEETIKKFTDRGIPVFRTDDTGGVKIEKNRGKLRVKSID